jgi:tetratricopeptide (TPR) repeat protein
VGAVAEIRSRLARDPGLAYLALALVLAALLYAPTLARGLTNYDDPWLVADNFIVRDASWASVHAIFCDLDPAHRFTLGAEYLPVRDLSLMLDFAVFGDWYPGFHAVSVAIYLAAIALWFHALAALGVNRRIAGLAMLVWAIHPSHVESVAWLAERKGVLGVAFAGAAVLGYARFRAGRSARWLVFAALAAVCAVWSKAPAAFAIAALAPLEVVLPGRVAWRRSLVGLTVVSAVTAAAFVPVLFVARQATVIGGASPTPGGHAELVLGVHGFYARLAAMIPRNAITYDLASRGPSALDVALGALVLAAALAVATVPRRRAWAPPAELRAAAWLWLLGWLPVSHALLPLQHTVADRYALLPTLGFALAVACGVSRLPASRVRTALIAAIVIAAGFRSCDAQGTWASNRALWARAVESDPADPTAWSQYAETLDVAGDVRAALAATAEGLRVAPSPVLQLREALLLREVGDAAGALVAMRAAAEAGEPKAMSNLALLELAAGDVDDALTWARRGAAAGPLRAQAQRTHGKVALAAHAQEEALAAFTRAYALEPAYLGNRFNLALALIALGRGAEARPHLDACASDPALGAAARAELGKLAPLP